MKEIKQELKKLQKKLDKGVLIQDKMKFVKKKKISFISVYVFYRAENKGKQENYYEI